MPEPDDADIIERAPRQFSFPVVPGLSKLEGIVGTGRRRLVLIAAAGAVAVAAAALVMVRLPGGPRTDPALAALITEVTTVPVGTSVPGFPALGTSWSGFPALGSPGGAYSSTLTISLGTLSTVSGPPLTRGGKPEVLYIATEYCPYCAMENWPLIVALSRFGTFTGLTTSRSAEFEHIAPVDSWTFYGSHYTSPYLAFSPVEEFSNVRVNAKTDPNASKSYRKLQRLTPAQRAIITRYDKHGSVPFLDFGGRAVQVGSGQSLVRLMTGKSWQRLAAAFRQPKTELGRALLIEADSLTAELCRLTGDRPASACPAFLRAVQLPS